MGAGCHLNGAHVIAPKCRGITYYTDGRGNIPRMHNSAYAEKFPQYYAAHKVLTSLRKQYRDSVMGSGVSACSNLFINHAECMYHPYLISLPFYTIPTCLFLNTQNFPLIYIYTTTCENNEKHLWFIFTICGCRGNGVIHMHMKFHHNVCYC